MYLAFEHLTTSRITHHTPSHNYIKGAAIKKCARFFHFAKSTRDATHLDTANT